MFVIRSTRAQGANVEVVEKGRTLYKPIRGMGFCESEQLTDDIKIQEKMGYVLVSVKGEASPTAVTAEIPEVEKEETEYGFHGFSFRCWAG